MTKLCFKCGVEHWEGDECMYGLTYERWLLDQLKRVQKALKTKCVCTNNLPQN